MLMGEKMIAMYIFIISRRIKNNRSLRGSYGRESGGNVSSFASPLNDND